MRTQADEFDVELLEDEDEELVLILHEEDDEDYASDQDKFDEWDSDEFTTNELENEVDEEEEDD